MTVKHRLLSSNGLILAIALSGCGGGGGGPITTPAPLILPAPAPTPTPPPAPTPAPNPPPPGGYNTGEYQRSNAAASSNALAAYNRGITGAGVKIGVIDSGIKSDLAEFAGKIDSASRDVASNRGLDDEDGHGTAVAGVAVAARNGTGTHGVAFDSSVIVMRADSPGSCAKPEVDDQGGCEFGDTAISTGVDAARMAGAKVINMSLGGSVPNVTLLNAMSRAVNAGIVLVISAGNDGDKPEGADADPFAVSPAQRFPGSVIIAGSVGVADGAGGTDVSQLSTFSNKAGVGADSYLAALGYRDLAISNDGNYYFWSGTSFAAPTISGAVALMAQAFPNLTGRDIVDILFKSAVDLGAPGVDPVFGRGRLDLARAFQPIGPTSLGDSKVGISIEANGDLPAAAGDAQQGKGGLGVVILDGYSRAFALDLAKTLRQANSTRPLESALGGRVQVGGAKAGPFSVALTVSHRAGNGHDFELARLGIGPRDAARARLIAGAAIARLDERTAAAFGFAEGAKSMERRLSGASVGAFLIAKDAAGDPGFSARRGGGMALRRTLKPFSTTFSAEDGTVWQDIATSADGSSYRLVSLSIDRAFGSSWLSMGITRLNEQRTVLGGHLSNALGSGASSTTFFDIEGRRVLSRGISAALSARRGWTRFGAGRFQSDAYAFDLAKDALLSRGDRIGLRVAQPLRIASGGFATMLPTSFDYGSMSTGRTLERFALSPSGRELDAELSYGRPVTPGGWLGGNLFVRRQPGHIASAEDDIGGAVRLTLSL